MQYRKLGQTGIEVSALGFGIMRLSIIDGKVDQGKNAEMLRLAVDSGVSYIDTAYSYHHGKSEVAAGPALRQGFRDKVYIATKAPVWHYEQPGDFDRILNRQIERLQTMRKHMSAAHLHH